MWVERRLEHAEEYASGWGGDEKKCTNLDMPYGSACLVAGGISMVCVVASGSHGLIRDGEVS